MPNELLLLGIIAASALLARPVHAQPAATMPPASATVSSDRPTLEANVLFSPVSFEVCSDHACARSLDVWDVPANPGRVRSALAPGMYFWRVAYGPDERGSRLIGRSTWSPTRPFRVPKRPRASRTDSAWGGFLDVNCDGFGDVAVATHDARTGLGAIDVFPGSAAGLVSSPAWSLPTTTRIDDVSAVGDLNNDGCGDLGVVLDGSLTVLPGARTGLGKPPWMVTRPPDARPGARLMLDAAGSVDRNGADLIVHGGGSVWVYAGVWAGVGDAPGRGYGPASEPGFEVRYGGASDFTGDGYGDIVLLRAQQGQARDVKIIPGSGLGPGPSAHYTFPAAAGPASCAGDLDADGLPELVLAGPASVADGTASGVSIYRRDATAVPSQLHQQIAVADADLRVRCADVDGDGRDDLLVRHREAGATKPGRARVSLYLGGEDGRVTLARTLREEDYVADLETDFAAEMSATDVDGDGRLELVLTAPAAADAEAGTGRLLVFAMRGDDLGRPTVHTGGPGFAQKVAAGFR